MKKAMIKAILLLISALLSIILLATVYLLIVSTGKIEPYYDEKGNVLEGSIAEKIDVNLNGADNGLIIRGKSLDNPILLFVSSGPGTSDYFFNEKYKDMNLDNYFTVCYWDYRGMCLVYDKNIDPETITTEVLMQDTLAVTDYLRERFNKDKIYIMGFSGGTNISLQAANLYPEKYYALFNMAQVHTGLLDNDTIIYDFMKKTFTERGDKRRLKKLEKIVDHHNDGTVSCHNWYEYVYLLHEAGGGTTKDESEFVGIDIPIMTSHCYTFKEKFDYIKGMKMYRKTPFMKECDEQKNAESIPELQIPTYFISGEYDYNAPWESVEAYCKLIKAPDKDMLLVPDAAHSPLWENPEVTVGFMISKIQ